MSDLISRQKAKDAIDKFIPADPMKNDYTKGISVGLAIATRCIEEFSQETDESSQGLVKDLISRQDAIDAFEKELSAKYNKREFAIGFVGVKSILENLPSAEPERCEDCENFSRTRLLIPQPEIIRCKDCIMHGVCRYEQGLGADGYCSQAERRTDE